VDRDLDDALERHDGHGAHIIRHCRDGAHVPVPLCILTSDQSQAKPSQELVTRELGWAWATTKEL
jgi:hypothetical protein